MKNAIKGILKGSIAAGLLLAVGSAGCGSSTSSDVAYEDDYAGDYYYPADVAYSGVYAGGWGYYGIYAATPAGTGASAASVLDGGHVSVDGGVVKFDGGSISVDGGHVIVSVDAGHTADAGGKATGSTTVREAVGQAIREAALGGVVCAGQATVTPKSGTTICGVAASGVNIVFNGCQLSGGGTIDGTVDVQITRAASDTTCGSATTITLAYASTITNLTYTGTGGAKIVIPNEMSTSTLTYSFGQAPTTANIQTNGEIQRFASGGSMTSDRTYTGTYNFSSISLPNQSYTVGGMLNVTDKAGGTATFTGTDIARDTSCCRPTGGSLAVARTGGSHAGSHTWTFTSTCGLAMLDGKTVTLPACL
ncbi:MAG TPA: hypothetical protein VLA79_06455 [Polyangia bacterium]|nr:hypothetical protein [Polyangia bacterium]